MFRFLVLSALILSPNYLLAAVTINEVAWMGSLNSANDEWIELYNDGGSVSVDGWVLSDGQGLDVSLAGAVGAGQYVVLERTDDSSATGNAFLIYTGALGNDGRTLTLKRDDGSIEDQVVEGTDWSNIGGDNVTKESAQYTAGGWVTGTPTPGEKNVSTGTQIINDNNQGSVEVASDDSRDDDSNLYISLVEPDNELALEINASKTSYVNQPITLKVVPSGLGKAIMDSLNYTWNFGNLATSSGEEVKATYGNPGTYVIVVEAKYTKYMARARHTITILPTTVSIVKKDGDILIQNNAHYEVDLSGFTLAGNKSVIFPEHTFLAPKATMIVSDKKVSDYNSTMVMLYDRAREVVASTLDEYLDMSKVTDSMTAVKNEITPVAQASVDFLEPEKIEGEKIEPKGMISASSTSKVAAAAKETDVSLAAAATTANIPSDKLPYLGLMGLIIVGILGLYSQGQKE